MKNLLMKEFRLAAHPTNWIFLLLSAFILIPNYPYLVTFFYTSLGIFFVCLMGRENHDIDYTVALPVGKKQAVTARFAYVAVIELLQVVTAIIFAIIRSSYPSEIIANQAGSAASYPFFGFAFLLMGVFNILFFPHYYKNPDKVGKCFIGGSIAAFAVVILDVVLSNVPAIRPVLSTYGTSYIGAKLGIMFGGIAVGVVLTAIAYKLSVQRFEKLDL